MTQIRGLTRFLAAAWVALSCLAVPAAAHSSYQLRTLGLETNTGNPLFSFEGSDDFNNGDLATGRTYIPKAGPGSYAGGYATHTFSAGAEMAGPAPDFLGQRFGIGGVAFRPADATLNNTNLTPAGFEQRSLTLQPANVPGTGLGVFNKNAGFEAWSVWNFVRPEPGNSMLLYLNGTSSGLGATGTSNYSDRLRLSLATDYLTGESALVFEQQSRIDGVFSRTTLEKHALGSLGLDLLAVDYLELNLRRELPTVGDPNPAVRARVAFYDAALNQAGDGLVLLGQLDFLTQAKTFANGPATAVSTAVTWLSPVPEPGSAALLLLGLALAVGLRRINGRAACASSAHWVCPRRCAPATA